MDLTADYTISVCEIAGYDCLMIKDNKTGKYLEQDRLEEWVQYVGGELIDRYQ